MNFCTYKTGMKQFGNRGMGLESDINETNQFYLLQDKAVIHKKPTSITIAKVDYPSRYEATIKEAYFKTPSTTDYNGIYRGRYIDFEAKETNNPKFFPLSNIHNHQIKHLKQILKHGGIGFLIIRFKATGETFYLEAEKLMHFLATQDRKSIPIAYFKEKGHLVKEKFQPRLDYLSIIDELYFKGE